MPEVCVILDFAAGKASLNLTYFLSGLGGGNDLLFGYTIEHGVYRIDLQCAQSKFYL